LVGRMGEASDRFRLRMHVGKLVRAVRKPSGTPISTSGAPSAVERNTGRMAVTIAWFRSLNRQTSPMSGMLRLGQPLRATPPD